MNIYHVDAYCVTDDRDNAIEYSHATIYVSLEKEKAEMVKNYCVDNRENVNDLSLFDKFKIVTLETEKVYGVLIPELM